MQPGEALAAAAQIAVAVAGFTGVVVAFGSGPIHEWSSVELFRLKLLIGTSVFPLVWSLAGLVLLTTGLSAPTLWSWCSAMAAALLLPGLGFALRDFLRLGRAEQGRAGRAIFTGAAGLGLLVILLQVYNILVLRAFWPFFTIVTSGMTLSVFQFVRMTLDRTRRRKASGAAP